MEEKVVKLEELTGIEKALDWIYKKFGKNGATQTVGAKETPVKA